MRNKQGEIELLKFHLDKMKFIWEKIKLQRDVMDRYFHYFLLFVTTPLMVLGAFFSKTEALINPLYISSTCFLLSGIGFSFFAMYNKQRINSINAVKELQIVERLLEEERYNKDNKTIVEPDQIKSPHLFSNRGADFWVSVIQGLISSFWFASGVFFVTQKVGGYTLCILNGELCRIFALIIITVAMTLLALIMRRISLKNYEE